MDKCVFETVIVYKNNTKLLIFYNCIIAYLYWKTFERNSALCLGNGYFKTIKCVNANIRFP